MLPARFCLHRPSTTAEALALLAEHGDEATPYAGGTEILVAMKARVVNYRHVVDLKRVDPLRGVIRRGDGTIVIGSLSTHHELANDPLIREFLPAYAEMSENIANIRVRVVGTLGGNLCFAEPHADPPTLLCALDASVVLAGISGERIVSMADFIQGDFATARHDGELLVRVEIPPLESGARAAYRSFGQLERPAAGVAAVHLAGGTWRFWAGALVSKPIMLAETAEEIDQRAGRIDAHGDLHGSAKYKRHLVGVLARRAMRACLT